MQGFQGSHGKTFSQYPRSFAVFGMVGLKAQCESTGSWSTLALSQDCHRGCMLQVSALNLLFPVARVLDLRLSVRIGLGRQYSQIILLIGKCKRGNCSLPTT